VNILVTLHVLVFKGRAGNNHIIHYGAGVIAQLGSVANLAVPGGIAVGPGIQGEIHLEIDDGVQVTAHQSLVGKNGPRQIPGENIIAVADGDH